VHPKSLIKHRLIRSPEARGAVIVGGLIASLALHGLLLTPLLLGTQHHRPRTLEQQGASAHNPEEQSVESMEWVFVEDSQAIRDPSEAETALTSQLFVPNVRPIPVDVLRASVAQIETPENPDDRPAVEASGNEAGRSLLFGRYMGQISARVERAWMRPRSVPRSGSFACRVQITQDRHGNVQEVTLTQCTDDPRWQVSLVEAINSASPFPAPPDPSVFSSLITMDFDSEPFTPGGSDQGFEPDASSATAQSS